MTKAVRGLEDDVAGLQKSKRMAEERAEMLSGTLISHEENFKKETEEI